MEVFDFVMKNAQNRNPIHLFCTGPGGVGKSYLIHCITQNLCKKYPRQHGVKPVLLAGPTGICSRNINGVTLHSLLKLSVDSGKRMSYQALGSLALKQL